MARKPRTTARAAPLPAELAQPIATTANGRDITQPWIGELKQPLDQRLWGPADWGPYDRVLLDDQVKSCLAQRIGAVVSRDWHVLPGDEQDPRSVEAAERFTDVISAVSWDRVTEKMLYGVFYGYAVAELLWNDDWDWRRIHVRHARRFRFDQDDQLRLLTTASGIKGEPLPTRKFWVVKSGGTDDDHPYGRGLAEWLYWPVWFKRNGVRFWNVFLDKYSVPTVKGTYPRGATKAQINDLLASIQAIATDTGIAVPEGFLVELIEQAKQGADFGAVCRYMDGAIAKIILSQTMTTDSGSSLSQAQVHADVKLEIIKADADLLTDSFGEGPARWWTDAHYGPDVAAPRVVRVVEEPTDLKAEAETDEILSRIGWELTDEAFADKYGEGYKRAAPPAPAVPPPAVPTSAAQPGDPAQPAQPDSAAQPVVSFAATDPRPLYVYRRVQNAEELLRWAKDQGFTSLVSPGDLRVTIAYSRQPVNWFQVADEFLFSDKLELPAGGPRVVDRLGDQGAIVLHFASEALTYRNKQIRERGASWDYAQYLPHITLTYQSDGVDLAKVLPYTGRIVLGPEIFEALEDDWSGTVTEISLAEPDPRPRDVVDEAVDAIMAQEGWAPAPAPIASLVDQLKAATSFEDMLAILRREAELGDQAALTESLARAGFALRLDALTDDGGEG